MCGNGEKSAWLDALSRVKSVEPLGKLAPALANPINYQALTASN